MVDVWQEFEPVVIDLFRYGIEPRLAPGETFEDAMDLSFSLSRLRVNRRNRSVTAVDVELMAAAFCWWPLKPVAAAVLEQQARRARTELLAQTRQRGYLTDRPWEELPAPSEQLVTVLVTATSDDLIEFMIQRGEAAGPAHA